jgi:RNA polymerase sigma factor (sigma-70 family)
MLDSSEAEKFEQIAFSEAVILEVRQVLHRLKLDQPSYSGLVPERELIDRVREQLGLGRPGDLAYRAICRKIYELCDSEDETLYNLAYQWLGAYLYYGIRRKVAGESEAEDLTNDCLEIVYRKRDTCHKPEAFLTWASRIASREVLQHFRKRATIKWEKEAEPLQKVQQQLGITPETTDLAAPLTFDPETLVLSKERLEAILIRINSFQRTKRAENYRKILYGTYFLGLEDKELAEKLGLSILEVQKMRSHALTVLRNDRDWIDKLR